MSMSTIVKPNSSMKIHASEMFVADCPLQIIERKKTIINEVKTLGKF
uniref:Uncharacterized protein n=1 Tax=Lepeophtheirus salmonis TaxID=72036 RepID=A0A0K2TEA3_LEPSM